MEIGRRSCIDKMTAAELAIRQAIIEVEKVGADVRLTDAIFLLIAAQMRVADYVDGLTGLRTYPKQDFTGVEERPVPHHGSGPEET